MRLPTEIVIPFLLSPVSAISLFTLTIFLSRLPFETILSACPSVPPLPKLIIMTSFKSSKRLLGSGIPRSSGNSHMSPSIVHPMHRHGTNKFISQTQNTKGKEWSV
nr:hypothetical protein [Glycine max]UBY46672.1 hypothetical protein [Glycine max]